MLISLRADGTAEMLLPSHVYQGSNVANVYVTAPFPNTTVLQVGFTLPNGTTASAPMAYVKNSDGIWQYTIAAAITNEAGAASVSITATTQTGQVIASQSVPFTIEETTLPVLPDTPSQDEYTLILQYIQQNSANIATIQGQISTIEEDVATANANASAAVSTANAAQQTAEEAQTTANGFASQIAQANANASAAVDTANQAASEVGQYTAQISEANANASAAQSAVQNIVDGTTPAGKATADGNGNNIVETYGVTSVTNTTAASGKWVIQAATAGSYLIGTFNSNKATNIFLNIEGGQDESETSVDVNICLADGAVTSANCYTRSIITNNTIKSVYYTISGGYIRIFVALNSACAIFVTANVIGVGIAGRGNSSVQYPSGGTNIPIKNYIMIDPTTLTPSTANGWTEGGGSLVPASAGKYFISVTDSGVQSIGEVTYNGTTGYGYLAVNNLGTNSLVWGVYIDSTGTYLTAPNGATSQPTTVYYKRQ